MFDFSPCDLNDEKAIDYSRSVLLAFMSDQEIPPVHRMTAAHELHKLIMISQQIKTDDKKPSKLKKGITKKEKF